MEPITAAPIKQTIRERALTQGFDAVGFAPPDVGASAKRQLAEFLAQGLHGDMGWFAANAERRADPRVLWPGARSAIVLGLNYTPEGDPLGALADRRGAAISVYARGRDYHHVLKKRLRAFARWIHETFDCEVKLFVDTAPLMEKPLAARAGIGWQGKHTNLVSRGFGSWLFLGEVLTTLELAADGAESDHCGSCRKCLDACPTNAFLAPYRIDARRCISYLTIEHKGHIPAALRKAMGNRIYGCDDCLAVCPWNKFARPSATPELLPRAELTGPRLAELAGLNDAAFRLRFAGTAVKRTGRDRLLRNILIALGNSGAQTQTNAAQTGTAEVGAGAAGTTEAGAAEACLCDASPLVRAMAVWALTQLLKPPALARLRERHLPRERDPEVRGEWNGAPAEA